MAARVSGVREVWSKITLDFAGPPLSETPETFRNFRLDVEFVNQSTGETLVAPGFFAADGDAAETGATAGTVWRVNFNPPSEGVWSYTASFRTGVDIAADPIAGAGSAVGFDGAGGSFAVGPSTAPAESFQRKGMILQEDGTHFLRHQGDGDYFVRGGPGVPENLLATQDFDNTGEGRHDFASHAEDYAVGDPTWGAGAGRSIVGAINYIAEQDLNAIYLLTNTIGGDGRDVGPWANPAIYDVGQNMDDVEDAAGSVDGLSVDDFSIYDVSKLAQWEILFDHMDAKGVYKNVLLQETENDQLLDGGTPIDGSTLSVERAVYLREMIARFGHNNGLQWNLGEETTSATQELEEMAAFVKAVDPYDHLVVVHTFPWDVDRVYEPLLGVEALDGPSFQTSDIRENTLAYRDASAAAGDPWVLAWDEDSSDASIIPAFSNDPDSENEALQRDRLWGHLTANGSGVNWYLKDVSAHSFDQNIDDFTGFTSLWTWTAAAIGFFNTHIPFWEMSDDDAATPMADDYVLSKPGAYYVAYLPYGAAPDAAIDLSAYAGERFDAFWFDPRNGGDLIDAGDVDGGAVRSFSGPPSAAEKDWVLFLRNQTAPDLAAAPVDEEPPTPPAPPDGEEPSTPPASPDSMIIGTTADDILSGGAGDDVMKGLTGDDQLLGKGGDDEVHGGAGRDVLRGGDGDDWLSGGGGGDVSLSGGAGADVVFGRGGGDMLNGGAGRDVLSGGSGSDVIHGGRGADALEGGAGRDLLTGGFGADQFVFAPADGRDVVKDFRLGVDRLDLSGFDGLEFDAVVASTRAANNGGLLIDLSSDAADAPSVIILRGVEPGALSADDVLL